MIAVGVPAFNRQYKNMNGTMDKRQARILGVAGTDVPLEDLDKLSLPYKVRFLLFESNYIYKTNIFS